MDRNPAEGSMIPAAFTRRGLSFAIAGEADDKDLRGLLARVAMDGWIRLAMTREPHIAAAPRALGHDGAFVIVRDAATGEALGGGEYSTSRVFLNGRASVVPYFAALRVVPEWRNRIGPLREGFELARQLQAMRGDAPFLLTSIAAGNDRARRFLTANLPGMPDYHHAGRMVTLAISTRRGGADPRPRAPLQRELPMLASFLMRQGERSQFAPVWDETQLGHVLAMGGLALEDFRILEGTKGIDGAIAVWDQRHVKQVIAAGYAPWLARLRPLFNPALAILRKPLLPRPGTALSQVYLSHAALPIREPDAIALIGVALGLARQKGAEVALLGLAADHPLLAAIVRRFGAMTYETGLYLVSWKSGPPPPAPHSGRMLAPDIAML